jgi:hypothetical protein
MNVFGDGKKPRAAPPPVEEEEEEDEEDLDEPEETGAPEPPEPPEPILRTAPKPKPKRHPSGLGNVGVIEGTKRWVNKDADALWPEILNYIKKHHRSPYEIAIGVTRFGTEATKLGTIEGASVLGDQKIGPGEALFNRVRDHIHMTTADRPMLYDLRFYWKQNGYPITTGRLQLPAPAEITAMRRAADAAGPESYGQYQPPPQHPPQYPPQHQPPPYGPPYGYPPPYYPPQAQPQHPDPTVLQELASLRAESAYFRGQLDEMLRAKAEGREPVISPLPPPPPPPAPPPVAPGVGALGDAELTNIAVKIAGMLGIKPGQSSQPAPPPPPPPPPPPGSGLGGIEDVLRRAVTESMNRIVQTTMSQVEKSVVSGITGAAGLGARPEDDDDEELPEVTIAPADPKDSLPFRSIKLDATWPDGRPVIYAQKPDGSIDYLGAAFNNPFILEKVAEGANALMMSGAETIKRIGSTPTAAGVGGPPRQMQMKAAPMQMPMPVPVPPQAPPPPQVPAAPAPAPVASVPPVPPPPNKSGWES